MGCDIHFFVETRNLNMRLYMPPAKWKHVSYKDFFIESLTAQVGPSAAAEIAAQGNAAEGLEGIEKRLERGWYHQRNYRLFGVLAGVRDPNVPRLVPALRGIPEDASDYVRYHPHGAGGLSGEALDAFMKEDYGEDWRRWFADGPEDLCRTDQLSDWHSRTWLSLKEMVDFDWDQTVTDTGLVDAPTYALWKQRGEGNLINWCKGTSGPVLANVEEMDAWIKEHGLVVDEGKVPLSGIRQEALQWGVKPPASFGIPYVRIAWKESLRSRVPQFMATLEEMQALAELRQLGLDDVRAVFYFDC